MRSDLPPNPVQILTDNSYNWATPLDGDTFNASYTLIFATWPKLNVQLDQILKRKVQDQFLNTAHPYNFELGVLSRTVRKINQVR